MVRKNIYVKQWVWDRLAAVAKEQGCNVSELIRRAIVEFLKKEESK
jgi:macrodomain Ter protein organizer (MatP/YcbG family)